MKILIVGGAGYVGSPLVYRLWQQGHEVTVFDALAFGGESMLPLLGQPRFRLVRGDIRQPAAIAEVVRDQEAVCMLAAIVGEPACNRDPEQAQAVNFRGAGNVLAAAKGAEVSRYVFISTCSNYGVSPGDDLINETAPLKPLSAYAETKIAAEAEALAAQSADFHPTVLRLSTAFGVSPRMRFDLMVSDFALAANRDRKIVVFGEQFWRPFVHVQDIGSAITRVLQLPASQVAGEVFNIGDNQNNLRKLELAQLLQRMVPGVSLETVSRATDPRSYRVDFSKANERLGWRAEWSVADGVREAVEALQQGIWPDPAHPRYYN